VLILFIYAFLFLVGYLMMLSVLRLCSVSVRMINECESVGGMIIGWLK
jgi:hypothetical protein